MATASQSVPLKEINTQKTGAGGPSGTKLPHKGSGASKGTMGGKGSMYK